MSKGVKPIPDGYHTLTPGLTIRGAARAIEFYKKAFGAEELCRMPGPDGQSVMHAEIKIGDSIVMLGDECPGMSQKSPEALGGTAGALHIYVQDVDAAFQRAVAAGATVEMPVTDMFWGDRFGKVRDPFGHGWSLGTHKEDVPPEEMMKRFEAWSATQAAGTGKK
jgi:PhnB protein